MQSKGKNNQSHAGRSGNRASSQPTNKGSNPRCGGPLKEDESISFQSDVASLNLSDPEDKTTTTHHATCLVCYTDDLPQHRAISPCGHDDVCALCHLRLRALHGTYACPICKTVNEKLIVDVDDSNISVPDPDSHRHRSSTTTIHHKLFEQYEMWGDSLGTNFVYRDDVGMFFPISYYRTHVVSLFSYGCKVPKCTFLSSESLDSEVVRGQTTSSLRQLQDHLRSKHTLTLCNLCVENKMDFVSCLPRFTPSQLKEHESKGDANNGAFKGHPMCEFCRPLRFYDLTKLHEHLNRDHYKCHLCEKRGKVNQFFKNYDKMAMHFDKEHYLCLHPQCLSARFVVFDNDIDLRSHEISIHGAARTAGGGGTKIQLEFRVRRSGQDADNDQQTVPTDADFRFGLDGEVFVPEALPSQQPQQVNEPVITYGPHAERTAQLRVEAERLRQAQQQEEEAFPSLGEGNRSMNGASFMGWTSDGVSTALVRSNPRALTEQNFPSLECANPLSRITHTTGLRSSNMSTNRGLGRSMAPNLQSTSSYRNSTASTNGIPSGYSSTPNLKDAGATSRPTTSFSATSSDFPALASAPTRSSSTHKISSLRYDSAAAYAKKNGSSSSENIAWASSSTTSSTKESLDAGIIQVESMKAYLGPKYKQLKLLTRNFASNEIHAESYVDQALTLFDDGIHDEMFWYFLPNLIRSCPNEQNSKKAQQYLESLRLKYGLNKT